MRARKISTKFLSSLWKTLRKSDQLSPKIGALNETDSPFRRRPARRFLELQCQKVRRTDDRSGDWQFIFLKTGWHKTLFYSVCLFCRSCSTPAGSSPSPEETTPGKMDVRQWRHCCSLRNRTASQTRKWLFTGDRKRCDTSGSKV